MLVAHIRPVDIVRTHDNKALEVLAAIVDGQQFGDDFPASIGVPRIQKSGMLIGTDSSVGTVGGFW